jgi:hypothetical protein
MKTKYLKTIILTIVLFNCTQLINAQVTEEKLLGTWVLDYEKCISNMSTEAQSNFMKIEQNSKRLSRFESIYKGRKITFLANAEFSRELSTGKITKANWILINTNSIDLTYDEDHKSNFIIELIGDDNLTMTNKKKLGNKKKIFPKLFYKKIL